MNTEESLDSKYANLLQPIRDLASNWNIDIARELEDYLSELEHVSFEFDGVAKQLNFAEAALLIQGSACIYSRKVEYLYNLVYQSLDFILSKNKKKQAISSVDQNGNDVDVHIQMEPEFLSLDDLPEADNIDIVDNDENDDSNNNRGNKKTAPRFTPLFAMMVSSSEGGTGESTTENLGGNKKSDFRINTASIHKTGALVLDDSNFGDDFLDFIEHEERTKKTGKKRNVGVDTDKPERVREKSKGKEKEVQNENEKENEMEIENENDKEKEAKEGEKDKDLNDLNNGDADLNDLNDHDPSGVDISGYDSAEETQGGFVNDYDDIRFLPTTPLGTSSFINGIARGEIPPSKSASEKETSADNINIWEDVNSMQDRMETVESIATPTNENDTTSHNETTANSTSVKQTSQSSKTLKAKTRRKPIQDIWGLMDPHEPPRDKEKPLAKGKTYKIPPMNETNSKTDTATQTQTIPKTRKKPSNTTSLSSLSPITKQSQVGGKSKWSMLCAPMHFTMRGAVFQEFTYLYCNNTTNTENLQTPNSFKTPSQTQQSTPFRSNTNKDEYFNTPDSEFPPPEIPLSQSTRDLDGDDDDYVNTAWSDDEGENINTTTTTTSSTFESGFTDHNTFGFTDNFSNIPPMPFRPEEEVQTYEELCRKHIEKYLSSANSYIQETTLSKRIREWTDRITPMLSEQVGRKIFDIHAYGDQLLGTMKTETELMKIGKSPESPLEADGNVTEEPQKKIGRGEKGKDIKGTEDEFIVPFAKLNIGVQPFEVCRRFAAILQLCNNGNVELISGKNDPPITSKTKYNQIPVKKMDDVGFILLTTKGKYDIANYRVPSQVNQEEGENLGSEIDQMENTGSRKEKGESSNSNNNNNTNGKNNKATNAKPKPKAKRKYLIEDDEEEESSIEEEISSGRMTQDTGNENGKKKKKNTQKGKGANSRKGKENNPNIIIEEEVEVEKENNKVHKEKTTTGATKKGKGKRKIKSKNFSDSESDYDSEEYTQEETSRKTTKRAIAVSS